MAILIFVRFRIRKNTLIMNGFLLFFFLMKYRNGSAVKKNL